MPIHQLIQAAAFDAAAVKVLTTAFDDTLKELGLERTDSKAEIIAVKIIECAQMGERNPARLRELATASYRM
jgi:Spy/CpxP family protein refolding chaperone